MATPPRKILLVATTGGFTHAAPVLEIGKVLASRGHTIEFATLEGQERWTNGHDFVSKIYPLGPGPTEQQLDAHYLRMRDWDISKGVGAAMESKIMFDSCWPQTLRVLKQVVEDPATRPDMIIADFFVDAVKDIHYQYKTPFALVMPNMPALMMPCSYIPGQPGFQMEGTLTSEDASMWLRFMNEWLVVRSLPEILKFFSWTKKARRREGVNYKLPTPKKPYYLVFVNSFFGLEVPRDLPPLAAPVGPILSDDFPPLDEASEKFLTAHKKVIYIGLGTHVILAHKDAVKIVNGLLRLLDEGLLDGVIWAVGKSGRQDLHLDHEFQFQGKDLKFSDLLDGNHPDWFFPFFAPQRAILDHESTRIYYTHGGGSSANEGVFHGKPMLSMGIFADQVANTTRLVAGGVAEPLNKFHFTTEELYTKAKKIIEDKEGLYSRNVLRFQRIATVASRRKHHAADLVEEVMYDSELRFKDGKELRPMHLETADVRMPLYKVKNWDLMTVGAVSLTSVTAVGFVLGKFAWTHREIIRHSVESLWRN